MEDASKAPTSTQDIVKKFTSVMAYTLQGIANADRAVTDASVATETQWKICSLLVLILAVL